MGTTYFVEMRMAEQRNVLCRWVEHYYDAGTRAQVLADSTVTAQHLDQLFWSFSQPSFIPHRVVASWDGTEPREPVIITVGEIYVPGFPVLLCDTAASLEFMARYEVAVHFVTLEDEGQRQSSRNLWQEGKAQGLSLKHVPFAKHMAPPPLV
ncbi:MAG: DNA polymerase III subunit chi [Syntrophobacteraceae bacterium]